MVDLQELTKLYVEQGRTLEFLTKKYSISFRTLRKLLGDTLRPSYWHNKGLLNPMAGKSGINNPNWRGGEIWMGGHIRVFQPSHPRATKKGYVPRAILVWEEYYGQPFPKGKEPHHDNEIKDDDRPENIIPLTPSEHMEEHNLRRREQ